MGKVWCICIAVLVVSLFLVQKKSKKITVLTTLLSAFLVGAILYREFLTGQASYLYTVADGYSQYLPIYMNYVRTFLAGDGFPFWTFSIGFGSLQSYDVLLYPLNLIPVLAGCLFGEEGLLICFAWMQLLKNILASTFMFLFLKKLKFNPYVCYIMGLVYAFCGVIILRGHWVFLADECYIIALLLWTVELYFQEGKWYFIPPVIFLIGCCLGAYYLYLYALLLIIYSTVRYIYEKRPFKKFFPFLFTSGGLFLLGALMWAVVLIGFSWSLFTTTRFSDSTGYMNSANLFAQIDLNVLLSGIASLFDPSITGVFENYVGKLNYLERPLFYCGIASLFLIPQGLALGTKKSKKLITFGLFAAGIYMMFPTVTEVFNAFIRNEELGIHSYRQSTLWITVMIIVMAAYGLDCVLKAGKCSQKELLISGIVLSVVLCYCYMDAPNVGLVINHSVFRWVIVFLLVWFIFLSYFHLIADSKKHNKIAMFLFVAFTLLEVGHSASVTLTESARLAKEYKSAMSKDSIGYYSNVQVAIDYIKEHDDGFYRITGVRTPSGAATYCTPLYFGFFDSSYYTDIDAATYEFLNEVYPESFINGVGSKYSVGVGGSIEISTLTGYKYYLAQGNTRNEIIKPRGYNHIKSIRDIHIYENENALSVGVAYDTYIRRSVFEKYTDKQQRAILLYCVVLDDEVETELKEFTKKELRELCGRVKENSNFYGYAERVEELQQHDMEVISWKDDYILGEIETDDDIVLSISIPDFNGWTLWVDGVETEMQSVNIGFMGVELSKGTHKIELKYFPKTLKLGAIISVCAILIYLLLLTQHKRIRLLGLQEQLPERESKPKKVFKSKEKKIAPKGEAPIKKEDDGVSIKEGD